jgi:hypothetical protein
MAGKYRKVRLIIGIIVSLAALLVLLEEANASKLFKVEKTDKGTQQPSSIREMPVSVVWYETVLRYSGSYTISQWTDRITNRN